jgi:hypothetical protein
MRGPFSHGVAEMNEANEVSDWSLNIEGSDITAIIIMATA